MTDGKLVKDDFNVAARVWANITRNHRPKDDARLVRASVWAGVGRHVSGTNVRVVVRDSVLDNLTGELDD